MKRFLLKAVFGIAFIFLTLTGYSQLANYTFTGNPGTLASGTTPTFITAGSMSSTGITQTARNNSWTNSNWGTVTTINTGKYLEFTITPSAGNPIDFTTLAFDYDSPTATGGSNGGPSNWYIRTDADTYLADVASGNGLQGNTGTIFANISALTGVTVARTFRIYFAGAENGSGTLDLDNVFIHGSVNSFVNYTFTANKTATSQPTGATAGAFTVTGGVETANSTTFQTNSWSTNNTIVTTDYYQVTITPAAGYKIDFTTFVFDFISNTSGPRSWAIRTSQDNYTTDLSTIGNLRGLTCNGSTGDLSSLVGVTSATVIRLYLWDQSSSGTQLFDLDNVKIGGVISPVTPASPINSPLAFSGITNALTTVTWTPAAGNISLATTLTAGAAGTATLTFAAQTAPPFPVGSKIYVAGVVPIGYNGTYTVTACNTTTVSYVNATTGATTNGTVTGVATGSNRLVIGSKNAAVTASPTDGAIYTASATFGSGTAITAGNFVLYDGTGTSVPVTGLSDGDFSYKVFTFDGVGATAKYYTSTSVSGNQATTPSAQPTAMTFSNHLSNGTGYRVNFTAVTGVSGYIAIRNTTDPVEAANVPANGVHVGTNAVGTALAGGTIAAYIAGGTGTLFFDDTGLSVGTTYFYDIYSFNGSGTGTMYLTGATPTPLEGSASTVVAEPASPVTLPGTPFTTITNGGFTLNWVEATGTGGTGTNRLVIVKKGSAVDATPSDGISYTANAAFSTGGSGIGPAGNFVVYNGTNTNVPVTNLTDGTYYVQIFTFSGSAGTQNYLTSASATAISGIVPSAQPTAMTFSNYLSNGTGYRVNFTAVTGVDGYVAIRNTTDPVEAANVPANGTNSVSKIVGSALAGGVVAAWIPGGTGTLFFDDTGLTAGTTYFYDIYSLNGVSSGSSTVFLTGATPAPLEGNAPTLTAEPSQASNITFSGTAGVSPNGTFTINFNNGGGGNRIVVGRAGNPVTFVPTDGTPIVVTPSLDITAGSSLLNANDHLIAAGAVSGPITITNLSTSNILYIQVFEYAGAGASINYNTTTTTGNPLNSTWTTTQATKINFSGGAGANTDIVVNFTNGGGVNGRIVVAKKDTPVDGFPVDNVDYVAGGGVFGSGTQIGVGNFVVATASGSTVTSLISGSTYYFRVFEYTGSAGNRKYNIASDVDNPLNSAQLTQATNINFSTFTTTSMVVNFTGGGNAGTIIVAKQGSAVDAWPVDGVVYPPVNAFGTTALGGGNFVVSGTSGDVITGLSPNTVYHFRAFDYVGAGAARRYTLRSAAGNPANHSTVIGTIPSAQATSVVFTATGISTSLNIKWTNGTSLGGRIVLVKPTNPIAVPADEPLNGVNYPGALTFGSATVIGPNGAKIVYNEPFGGTGGSTGITVTGLTAGTRYYVKVYEYDGAAGSESYLLTDVSGNPNSRFTVVAAAPLTQASGINFTTVTSSSIIVKWTSNGSGSGGRILLAKPTSTFVGVGTDLPTDGASFTSAGGDYLAGNATLIGAGSKVVYTELPGGTGGSTGVTVSNLSPGTQYFFAVLEYNGTSGGGDGTENYNVTTNGSNPLPRYTLVNTLPVTQTTGIAFTPTAVATTLFLKWTKGNGLGGRIVSISTAPFDLGGADDPTNGVSYTGNPTFGLAPSVGSGPAKVVYNEASGGGGGLAGITVFGLTQNTTYYFKVYEFDGVFNTGSEVYLTTDGALNNPNFATTLVQPTLTYSATGAGAFPAAVDVAGTFQLDFNVQMELVSGASITSGNIPTFITLIDNTSTLPVPFTSTTSGNNQIIITPTDSHIPGNNLTGSRSYKVTYANNAIRSIGGQVLLGGSNQVITTEVLVQPLASPTAATNAPTTTTLQLNWADAVGAQLPENYLVVGIETGVGSFPVVADLTDLALDPDLSNGTFVGKAAYGVHTLLVNTGLKSDKQYDFRIYSYTNEGAAINYNLAFLAHSAVTSTGTLTASGTGAGAATMASTVIDLTTANAQVTANFSFNVTDDSGTPGVDNAPTRVATMTINRDASDGTGDWTKVIGGVVLYDGTNSINSSANPGNFTIGINSILISGITALNPALGLIADNPGAGSTKTYQVRIWLRTDIETVPFDIDNKKVVLSIRDVDMTATAVGTNTSHFSSATAIALSGNNTVVVTADRLAFTSNPAGGNAGTGFPLAIAATDVSGNVDIDQGQQVTIDDPVFPGGHITFANTTPLTPAAQNMINGRKAWANVQVTGAGTYQFRVSDTDGAMPALTAGQTGNIIFGASSALSAVAENLAFVPSVPGLIDYKLYQHGVAFTLGVAPPADAIKVAEFIVQDGGASLVDPDGIGTTLTDITFTVTNPGNIRFAGISNGATMVATQPGSGSIAFSGLALLAEDPANGGSAQKIFEVWVSFNTIVTDNVHFEFQVANVQTNSGGSTFALTTGGAAQSSTLANKNKVIVSADRLVITTQPPASTLLGIAMSPSVAVKATDILGSLDIDRVDVLGLTTGGTFSTPPTPPLPTVTLGGGVGTYSSISHSATASAIKVTTSNVAGFINAQSNVFDIVASSASTIVTNAFVPPTNIAYDNFQEASDIQNTGTSINVAKFDVFDGPDADNAPTILTGLTLDLGAANFGVIRRIALYDAGGTNELSEFTGPITQTIAFPAFSLTAPDNGFNTFTVRVSFTQNVTDNQQFSFTVIGATTQSFVSSLIPVPAGAVSSTTGNQNRIEVTANHLIWTTDLISPILAKVNVAPVPSALYLTPVIKAVDQFNKVDLDYANAVTLSTAAPVTLSTNTINADNAAPNSGVYTFPANFQFLTTGLGTISATAPGLTGLPGSPYNSQPTTIIAGTATKIALGATPTPATISSLVAGPAGTEVPVFYFDVKDDPAGTATNNDDGLSTLISSLAITENLANNTVADWTQVIGGAYLYDNLGHSIPATSITTSPNRINFTGIPTGSGLLGDVPNNGVQNYSLRIYLNPNMPTAVAAAIDGKKFEFQVLEANIGLASHSTKIIPLESATSGVGDVVTVVATQLRFLSPASATSASLTTDFPGVVVEATDIHNNRDLNYTGASSTVRAVTVPTGGVTFSNAPVVGTTQFGIGVNAGLLNFASNFQFATGNNGDDVTLTVVAGPAGGSDCASGRICGTSPAIGLLSSFESSIVGDPTYLYSSTLDYVNHQEAADIQNTATSLEIARFILVDGNRTSFNYGGFLLTTGTNNDINPNGDIDGASTVLTGLTLRITRPSNLRRIALYSGGVEIGGTEQTIASHIPAITSATAFADFTFSGALLTALDDSQGAGSIKPISVRVSFANTSPEVADHDPIDVTIVAATLGGGSSFYPDAAGTGHIAGVPGVVGAQSLAGANKIDVLATKLDFTTQPAAVAGFNEPFAGGIVKARDQFSILDLDFSNPLTLSSSVTTTGANSFVNGVATLNLLYNSTGDGTLTVSSAGRTSNVNNIVPPVTGWPNVAIQCNHIDVIHTTTSIATGGVITSTNLAGNSTGKVIFGVTFGVPYKIPGEPKLQKFTISFSNPIAGVFNNIKVFESQSTTYSGGSSTDVTLPAIGATLSFPTSKTLDVTFPVLTPRDLSIPANSTLTYFLMVDIDPNASGSTPSIQPSLVDGGNGSGTNSNILTTTGSSTSSTTGQTYTFASIFPPILLSSNPSTGQLNVDPNQATLSLQFSVPVWSLDQKVFLTDQTINGTPVQLSAANGQYPLIAPNPLGLGSPLVFNMPPPGTLIADHVYYVTIAQGNQATSAGIMDENNNVYQGISYPGTLYFKVATTTPPKLLGLLTTPLAQSNPSITFTSTTGAIIDATFDQRGTAFYMILNHTALPPTVTNAQILAGTHPSGAVAFGSFAITQTTPISQFGVVTPGVGTPFVAGSTYDVWMYAQNDALGAPPAPYATGAPYGAAPTFSAGAVGPTIVSGSVPSPSTLVTLNTPTISICNNSYQVLNDPIVITEGTSDQFQTAGAQSLNIVLPAGFQFDVTLNGAVPKYGTLQLIGTDFAAGSGQLNFLGNAILKVTFDNTNSLTLDKIIISGLRVLASTSTSGSMIRLGGSAIPGIGSEQTMGTLSSFDAPVIEFDNSYSISLGSPTVVTSIPDNANPATLILTPKPAPPLTGTLFSNGDFGPSTFSGQGVNINVLTLSAVTKDVPFNITVNHTDNNGCISNNAIQYTVYDHDIALNITDNLLPTGVPVVTNPLNTYCADNDNFVVGKVGPQAPPTPGRAGHVRYVDYKNLAPFYMISMTADLPAGGAAGLLTGQIMNGAAWSNLIKTFLPVALTPTHTIGTDVFKDYKFDDAIFTNAFALSGGAIPEPYNNFISTVTSAATGLPITYYSGGSLGFIELTGNFQSRTNAQVKVPRVQRLEIFLPAIPIVDGSRPSFVDITDPNNPPYSVSNTGPVNNPGTLVYCEAGGLINISARPAAVPGTSVGTFTIQDAISGTTIPPAGFTDNTNGTAVLNPSVVTLKNGYKDIKVTYTYQDIKSPCSSTSYQIIRITPNPVGGFDKVAVIGNNTPTVTSYCIGNQINFDANSANPVPKTSISAAPVTVPVTPANTIQSYNWDFGDVNSSTNIATGITQSHTFGIAQTYAVTLTAQSNWGCPLVTPYVQNIKVGGIPTVKIKFDGVSTADTFNFSSNGSTVSSNDTFESLAWDFGDGSAITNFTYSSPPSLDPGTNFTHSYATAGPGRKFVDLKVTSTIGCVNSLSLTNAGLGLSTSDNQLARTVVVLPIGATAPGGAGAYQQYFETNDGSWQVWFAGTPGLPVVFSPGTPATPPPSWVWNAPDGTVIKPDPNGLNGANAAGTGAVGKYWKTYDAVTKKYTGFERSALYSPMFDISTLGTPMLSFSNVVQMEASDGVIVEYSTDDLNIADPLKKWNVLGSTVGEGVQWFTDKGIAAKPGNQVGNDFGWSNFSNTAWQTSKHTLDEIGVSGNLKKVVLRFSLASAKASPTVEGFAIDNVRVGDRTRTILLESFQNTANTDPAEAIQNTAIANFPGSSIGTQVIKVDYHVNFPGNDPFNNDNPADPSARALYYNIVQTPKSRLDGFKDPQDRAFTVWSQTSYGTRSLQLAQAVLNATATNSGGKISVSVSVTAVFDLPANTILQVAVVEKGVPLGSLNSTQKGLVKSGETNFVHVLKKMIPTAAGTLFGTLLPQGASRTFPATAGGLDWVPDPTKMYLPVDDLRVVVFLQNESNGEIYQVNYVDVSDPAVVTGLEPIAAEDVVVYPVPANHEMNIRMPGALMQAASVQMIDQVGRVAVTTSIAEGENSKTINTRDLAAGVYILTIEVGPGNITRKKVMVVHEE